MLSETDDQLSPTDQLTEQVPYKNKRRYSTLVRGRHVSGQLAGLNKQKVDAMKRNIKEKSQCSSPGVHEHIGGQYLSPGVHEHIGEIIEETLSDPGVTTIDRVGRSKKKLYVYKSASSGVLDDETSTCDVRASMQDQTARTSRSPLLNHKSGKMRSPLLSHKSRKLKVSVVPCVFIDVVSLHNLK